MLVRRIKEFIDALSSIEGQLNEHDLKLFHIFQDRYLTHPTAKDKALGENKVVDKSITLFEEYGGITENKIVDDDNRVFNDEDILNEEELNWIQGCFADRWDKIADDISLDYTFYPGGVNFAWVLLARDLASELNKPHVLILIPVLVGDCDPNNFSLLDDVSDARSLYLSNDNTWHRVWALFQELQKTPSVFAIFDKPEAKRRALTLNELYRLRSKRGDELAFETKKGEYFSFWNYVMRESAPTWQQHGYCPTHLLPTLLEMIEKYFEAKIKDGDLQLFHKLFEEFSVELAKCPLADINHLYGIPIVVNGANHFLVEILLECMEGKDDLSMKLLGVAQWLCQFNPSLISQCESLAPIYKDLKAGENFDLTFLRELVTQLNINDSDVVKPLQEDLLFCLDSIIGTEGEIKSLSQIIKKIKVMYALRWETIIDSSSDYTRMKNPENQAWIRLAQYLAGAGYVNINYYKLLMPTLTQDIEPVTKEPITAFPLSHLVLSTDGDKLIYLPSCVRQYEINGTFYNCNYYDPRPLSPVEKERLKFAAPEFYKCFLRANKVVVVPPISKKTVDALRKLVNGSLNPSGLYLPTVGQEEFDIATKSYDEFLLYLGDLSESEADVLFRQTILLGSDKYTFAEVMDLIQAPHYSTRRCIAYYGTYLAKLVMDYAPRTTFLKRIEQRDEVGITAMRVGSAKKIYSEYNDVDNKEATKRVLTLLVSLMTHTFSYLWLTGTLLRIGEYTNYVTDTGQDIFTLLETAVEQGNFEHIRFLYVTLVEHIVKPAIANKTWARYDDTDSWLKSIKNGSMFEKAVCFEPELLLTVLWPLALVQEKPKIKSLIEGFLDEVQRTLAQNENRYKKWIRVNIEFTKFLNHEFLAGGEGVKILEVLRSAENTIVTPELVSQTSIEFLIHRLALLGTHDVSCKQGGLFGLAPGQHKDSYGNLKKKLERVVGTLLDSSNDGKWLVSDIIAKLQVMGETFAEKGMLSMQIYLKKMFQHITPESSIEAIECLAMKSSQ